MVRTGAFKAVFFDLDGTLVDTAPDMVAVLQELQRDQGIEPISYDLGRSHVSNGAIGLLRVAFPEQTIVAESPLLSDYLRRYESRICEHSAVFDGLDELLRQLEQAAMPWGVVTNKPAYLTQSLLRQLGLAERSACTVSGDTLKTRKPDPGPLLHACEIAGVQPRETLYIGDAERDIEAGRRAGMMTIAAAYGYITAQDNPDRWGADLIAQNTTELAHFVHDAVSLRT